jgi:hypothetical protein
MVNPILPNGFGSRSAKDTPGYRSENERIQDSQKEALNNLKASIPPSRLQNSVPIDYDEYGMPRIDTPMPELDPSLLQRPTAPMDVNTFFTAPPIQRPGAAAQPKPQTNMSFNPPKKDNLKKHPVIQKLLKNFGLKKDKKYDVEIFMEDSEEKMVYSMALVTEELQSWVLDVAKEKVSDEGASVASIYFELLFVCCSVVAIDNVPTYEIFDIKLLDSEVSRLSNDPLDIPIRLRKLSAKSLIEILWSETRPIGDKLLAFYQEVISSKKVISSLDRDIESKVRFVCPLDECDHYEYLTPSDKVIYCKFHGIPMVETVDLTKETDIPLA